MGKLTSDPMDPLFTVPLAEFVATRNRLATELRKGGDKTGAAAAKAAVKPSVSAWAVNQAVRHDPRALRRLLEASDALRKAQLEGPAGGGEARGRYQEAVAEHRQAVDDVTDKALAALEEGGTAASPALRERIAGNLRWGPQARDTRELLEAGRLTRDVGPQDFEALARMAVGADVDQHSQGGGKVIPIGRRAASPARPPTKAAAGAKHEAADTPAARAAAREKEREAAQRQREQIAELRAQLRLRRQEADRASKQRAQAAAEVTRGKERVAELESALSEARAAVETARREERRAADAVLRAETAAQEATRALADAEKR